MSGRRRLSRPDFIALPLLTLLRGVVPGLAADWRVIYIGLDEGGPRGLLFSDDGVQFRATPPWLLAGGSYEVINDKA